MHTAKLVLESDFRNLLLCSVRIDAHAALAGQYKLLAGFDTRGQAQEPCTLSSFDKCQGTSGDILRPSNIQCLHLIPHTRTSETSE